MLNTHRVISGLEGLEQSVLRPLRHKRDVMVCSDHPYRSNIDYHSEDVAHCSLTSVTHKITDCKIRNYTEGSVLFLSPALHPYSSAEWVRINNEACLSIYLSIDSMVNKSSAQSNCCFTKQCIFIQHS